MTPEEITTFDQAREVFARYEVTVEKSTEPKIWVIGGVQRLDKGGVIQEARALLMRKAMQESQPPTAQVVGNAPVILEIRKIRRDGGTQSRAGIDEATVADYARDMLAGAIFPPVEVRFDGTNFWLENGFQRLAAAERIRLTTFAAIVRQGTRRDAVLASCGANATHGLRRSDADKERAVLVLLEDAEWGKWSNRAIARHCKVSHHFVRKVAERHGLTGRASSEKTYTTKHGTTAMMQTATIAAANIARAKEEPASAPQPGQIHPLIEAIMDPQSARSTEPTQTKLAEGMPVTPAVIGLPVGLLTTGWKISAPSGSSAFFVAHNAERGVSTQGFTDLAQATSAAEQAQELIDDIEAQGWTIRRDLADPRQLRATHPQHPTITGAASLAALHRLIPTMSDPVTIPTRPAIGTQTTTPDDTDIGEQLTVLDAHGWRWHGATYTADGWVHLVASMEAPDLARQRLNVAGIANLLSMLAHTTKQPVPPTMGTSATTPDETDLGDLLAALEDQGWRWDGARTTTDGWEHMITHTVTQDFAIVTRAGIADLLQSADPTSARMALDEWITPQSQHLTPLVPHVLVLANQPNPYEVPDHEILTVLYHTAEMIAGRRHDDTTCKRRQERVYCLPDEAAQERVELALSRYRTTLTAIATYMRSLGTYEARLAAAGGIERAPNPLTPTVIFAHDPDGYHAPSFDQKLAIPRAERRVVKEHTAKMLRIERSAVRLSSQAGYFVCPDDAAWEQLEQLRAAAIEAHAVLVELLDELGTYQQALADGRYRQQAAPTPVRSDSAISWPDLYVYTDTIRQQIEQRNQAGVIREALNLLGQAQPGAIVMPLYPPEVAAALSAEIAGVLAQIDDQHTPHAARLLRAIQQRLTSEEPHDGT